jgi:hypothetical protein
LHNFGFICWREQHGQHGQHGEGENYGRLSTKCSRGRLDGKRPE